MQLSDYQKLTSRTNTDLGSPAINAAHVTLGIVGEWNEACKENISFIYGRDATKESVTHEYADVMWYTSELANLFDLTLTILPSVNLNETGDEIAWIAENIKKYLAYNKNIDIDHLSDALNKITTRCQYEIKNLIGGYTFEQALDMNIEKLQKRFPEKFSAELAIAKGDEN